MDRHQPQPQLAKWHLLLSTAAAKDPSSAASIISMDDVVSDSLQPRILLGSASHRQILEERSWINELPDEAIQFVHTDNPKRREKKSR